MYTWWCEYGLCGCLDMNCCLKMMNSKNKQTYAVQLVIPLALISLSTRITNQPCQWTSILMTVRLIVEAMKEILGCEFKDKSERDGLLENGNESWTKRDNKKFTSNKIIKKTFIFFSKKSSNPLDLSPNFPPLIIYVYPQNSISFFTCCLYCHFPDPFITQTAASSWASSTLSRYP